MRRMNKLSNGQTITSSVVPQTKAGRTHRTVFFCFEIQPLLCWLGSDYGYIIDADDADDDVDGIADG